MLSISISSLVKPSVQIESKRYTILNQIGEGGFAFVYRVKSCNKNDMGTHYALKKIICSSQEQLEEAKKEVSILNQIAHNNVLPLLASATVRNSKGQDEVFLLLPLYAGTVQSKIDNGKGNPHCAFNDGLDVVNILRQVCEGLQQVHSLGYRHAGTTHRTHRLC